VLGVPAEHVDEGVRGGRGGGAGPDGNSRLHRGLARQPAGEDGLDEITNRFGLAQDGVREADAERILEPRQQLHALETADAEVAVEHIDEGDAAAHRRGAQLCHEGVGDGQHPTLDDR
jgi:hypothetical protein